MRTARFLVTGSPFDITATRRPPDSASRIWVVVEDASGSGSFRPAIGWLELPEEMCGHEDAVARGLELEVSMRIQMGPERDRVEALLAMLDGDVVRCRSAWPDPIAFESPAVPNLLRKLAGEATPLR